MIAAHNASTYSAASSARSTHLGQHSKCSSSGASSASSFTMPRPNSQQFRNNLHALRCRGCRVRRKGHQERELILMASFVFSQLHSSKSEPECTSSSSTPPFF